MIAFLYYPFYLIAFWYKDFLGSLFEFFVGFNRYVANLLSVPVFLRTFFRPLKNEYRSGLVLFSIVAGIIVKSFLLSILLSIILLILAVETLIFFFLLVLPILLILVAVR